MTWKWAIPAICLAFLAVAASAGAEEKKTYEADKGPDKVDVSGFPDDVQAAYKVFATKCSKCHTLARPINTDMTTGKWKRYVKRMSNKPKSGISQDEAKEIFTFLKFYQSKKDAKK
jgi:mono/diheme cytochrome c family protein